MMENAKRIVSDLTGIGVALIALGVVLGVVIGTDVAFVPNVLCLLYTSPSPRD